MKPAGLLTYVTILAFCPAASYAKDKHPLQTAEVLSQRIAPHTVDRGLMTSTPLVRYSNVVVVETETERMGWEEVSTYKVGTTTHEVAIAVPLPVHGHIQFYRDGNFCIVKDEGGKKHKFLIVHIEAKTE